MTSDKKIMLHNWPTQTFVDPELLQTVRVYCPNCKRQNELHHYEAVSSMEPALVKNNDTGVMAQITALTVTLFCPECHAPVAIYGLTTR